MKMNQGTEKLNFSKVQTSSHRLTPVRAAIHKSLTFTPIMQIERCVELTSYLEYVLVPATFPNRWVNDPFIECLVFPIASFLDARRNKSRPQEMTSSNHTITLDLILIKDSSNTLNTSFIYKRIYILHLYTNEISLFFIQFTRNIVTSSLVIPMSFPML